MSRDKDIPPKVKRRLVLENSVFDIFMDDIEENGETVVKDFLVISQKNKCEENLVGGVAVLPVFEETIGLLLIYRHPVMACVWETPRGFLDKGESAEQAALRELEEETGLSCDRTDLRSLGYMMPDAGVFSTHIQLFVALNCKKVRDFSSNELGHKKLRFFTIAKIGRMIARSEIQDPCTMIAYFKCTNDFKIDTSA